MKPAGLLGVILVVIGLALVAYGGYTSFTTKANVAKLGPLEINKQAPAAKDAAEPAKDAPVKDEK